jgi:hypothetical protein
LERVEHNVKGPGKEMPGPYYFSLAGLVSNFGEGDRASFEIGSDPVRNRPQTQNVRLI